MHAHIHTSQPNHTLPSSPLSPGDASTSARTLLPAATSAPPATSFIDVPCGSTCDFNFKLNHINPARSDPCHLAHLDAADYEELMQVG
jgi:hypothetical protein